MTYNHENAGIFASPTEPIFNMKPSGVQPELLEEWLFMMAAENTEMVKLGTHKQGYFKNKDYAETVFQTCEKLRLRPETRYLSVEIFDRYVFCANKHSLPVTLRLYELFLLLVTCVSREGMVQGKIPPERFMIQHMKDLHDHVKKSDSSNKRRDWLAIQERVKNQVLLRMVTCCQLASKLTSHYRIVTPKKVKALLGDLGHKYNLDSILQSELRVLKTLNYKVWVATPLTYIETILEVIGHNDSTAEVKMYHGVCLKMLDLFYMNRQHVYKQLFKSATGQSHMGNDDRAEFAGVENDRLLMSVGVIAASSYIVDQLHTDKIIEQLGRITCISNEDILDFATVLIQLVIEGHEQ